MIDINYDWRDGGGPSSADRSRLIATQQEMYNTVGLQSKLALVATEKDNPSKFSETTGKTYRFTTENISDYLPPLLRKLTGDKQHFGPNSHIACITGSSDFVLNALLTGAKRVDAVDVMSIPPVFGELKLAAVRHLTQEEFMSFLKKISFEHYARLRGDLTPSAVNFFDQFITPAGVHPLLTEKGGLFIEKIHLPDYETVMNPYLQGKNYYELQRITRKGEAQVWFYPEDIESYLRSHQIRELDLVHLSNIFTYPPYRQSHVYDLQAIDRVLSLALGVLKKGGMVYFDQFALEESLGKSIDKGDLKSLYSLGDRPGVDRSWLKASVPHNSDYQLVGMMFTKR